MRLSERHPAALGAYALAALLALLELGVLWQALHPQVPPDYRAYYIDRTTTCMNQPMSGAYVLGTPIDFRTDNTKENRPCGWEGPVGDGVHALGETARLRFAVGAAEDLTLTLEMTGVSINGSGDQRVDVSVNGVSVGQALVPAEQTKSFSFAVPAAAIGDTGVADIFLDFPDAVSGRATDANTRKRSIKLVTGSLAAATAPGA